MRFYFEKGVLVWLAPASCTFTQEEVELLLPMLEDMRKGLYLPEPSESGYTGGSRARRNHRAPFEAAALLAAELDRRLARTGLDRYLIEDYYCRGMPAEHLSQKLQMEPWEVLRRLRSAVSYISSGPCPRWLNCIDCRKYQECPHKKRTGLDYCQWKRSRSRHYPKVKIKGLAN